MGNSRLVVIDDHTLFRTGLYELLERRGLSVVGMTGDPGESIALIEKHKPDITLLDLRLGEVGGLEVLQKINKQLPDQRVIILTTSTNKGDVLQSLRSGAAGYLLKDMDPDQLVEQINKAKEGETVVAQEFTGLLARAAVVKGEVRNKNAYSLTPREMDILKHIARGESNKHIASELGIVDGTVKLHVRAVLKKLGVQTRVQAALLAVSERLCEDDVL